MTSSSDNNFTPRSDGPSQALVEVLIHEIANPLQAMQSTLDAWRHDAVADETTQDRVRRVDTALERVATALRVVQAVKDSALHSTSMLETVQLSDDIASECKAMGIDVNTSMPAAAKTPVRAHSAALPLLIAAWANSLTPHPALIKLDFQLADDHLLMKVSARKGISDSLKRELNATSTAGYSAAIGEFLKAAGGRAFVLEDDQGELALIMYLNV